MMTEQLISDISKTLKFDQQLVRTSIYKFRKKYPVKNEDLEDFLMDSFEKYSRCTIDESKNKFCLFMYILKHIILDYYKKYNRISFYNDMSDEDYNYEEHIIEEDTYLYEKDR
jgi:hypothetical protein